MTIRFIVYRLVDMGHDKSRFSGEILHEKKLEHPQQAEEE